LDAALTEFNKQHAGSERPEMLVRINMCLAQREVNKGNKKNATEFYETACYRLEDIDQASECSVALAKLDYCEKVLFPETKTLEVLTESALIDNFVAETGLKYYNGVNLLVSCAKIYSLISRLCKREVEDGALGSMTQAERLCHLAISVLEKEDISNNVELSGMLARSYADAGEFYVIMMNAYQNVTEDGLNSAMKWYEKAIPVYQRFPDLVDGYLEVMAKMILIHTSRINLLGDDGEKVLAIINDVVTDFTAIIGDDTRHQSALAAKSEYWYSIVYSTMGKHTEAMKHGKENLKQVAMSYKKDSGDPLEHEKMYNALDGLFDIYWNCDGTPEGKEKAFHLLGTMMDAKERMFSYTPAAMQDITYHGVKKVWESYKIGTSIYGQMRPEDKYLQKLIAFEDTRIKIFLDKCNARLRPEEFLPDEQHLKPHNLKETILPAQIMCHMGSCFWLIKDYDTALKRLDACDDYMREYEERYISIERTEEEKNTPGLIYRNAVGFGVCRVQLCDAYKKVLMATNDVKKFKDDIRARMCFHVSRTLCVGAEHINPDIIEELATPLKEITKHLANHKGGEDILDETEEMLVQLSITADLILQKKFPPSVVEGARWNEESESQVRERRSSRLSISNGE
jgi:tetratricopeptide (TPR) repeat protein